MLKIATTVYDTNYQDSLGKQQEQFFSIRLNICNDALKIVLIITTMDLGINFGINMLTSRNNRLNTWKYKNRRIDDFFQNDLP